MSKEHGAWSGKPAWSMEHGAKSQHGAWSGKAARSMEQRVEDISA